MNFILFLTSLSLLSASGLLINGCFSHRKFIDWLVSLVLVSFAQLVLVMNIASALGRMNQPYFVLLLQLITLVIVLLLRSFLPFTPCKIPAPRRDFLPRKKDWALWLLLGATAITMLINIIYVLAVPPNNNDSLMIHLARIGMWHQQGSWRPWDTKVIWQVTFPLNAQLVGYWTLLFTNSERLLGAFPLVSGLLSSALVYQLSRSLSRKPRVALLVALAWLAMPVVQLNLTSTRHDHISTFLLLAGFYFLYNASQQKKCQPLLLAGLSLGLSIGTNLAVGAYLPGFFVMVLVFWLVLKRLSFRQVLVFSLAALLAFFVFSAPIYLSNWQTFGSPLGPDALDMTPFGGRQAAISPLTHVLLMLGRWAYHMADPTGIPQPVAGYLLKLQAMLTSAFSAFSGLSLEMEAALLNQHRFLYAEWLPFSEDTAWFGVLGGLAAFIGAPFILVRALKKRHPLIITIAIFLLTTAPTMAIIRFGWTPYDGRYFMLLMALLCVGCADLLSGKRPQPAWFLPLLSLTAVYLLVLSLAFNPAKAVYGYRAFYRLHRLDMISMQSYHTKDMLYLVDCAVPADGVLGLATERTVFYEYGLFGEHFTRRLVPVLPDEAVCDSAWLRANGVEYLLVDTGDGSYPGCVPAGYTYLDSMNRWIIFQSTTE